MPPVSITLLKFTVMLRPSERCISAMITSIMTCWLPPISSAFTTRSFPFSGKKAFAIATARSAWTGLATLPVSTTDSPALSTFTPGAPSTDSMRCSIGL